MAVPKPLLIPWLREQIDSGRYPGVNWTNEERTEFCIPWKHALRQDSNSDDVLIFKAWAETSRMAESEGGALGDPSLWKRNFRSALRARGFTMIQDNKNDPANPHKIYRWPKEGSSSGASCEPSPALDSSFEVRPLPVYENIYLAEEEVYLNLDENGPDLLEQCMVGLQLQESQTGHPLGIEAGVPECPTAEIQTDSDIIQEIFGGVPPEPIFLQEGIQQVSSMQQPQVQEVQPETTPPETIPFKTCFKVVVHYRGQRVKEELVMNEAGFRLAYRQEDCLTSDPALQTVFLPPPDRIHDMNQLQLTNMILQSLGGGLEVRVVNNAIHGSRHGDSKVFWSIDKHDQSRIPRELAKQTPETIFSIKDFISDLIGFMNREKKCPPISVFFCLGEKWPDPKLKPWEKKLIMVEVIFDALEKLKMMALDGGASSLQSSVELQISLEQMMIDMS